VFKSVSDKEKQLYMQLFFFKLGSFCAKWVNMGGRFQKYEGCFVKVKNLCLKCKNR
jgi:hypothetical protein